MKNLILHVLRIFGPRKKPVLRVEDSQREGEGKEEVKTVTGQKKKAHSAWIDGMSGD